MKLIRALLGLAALLALTAVAAHADDKPGMEKSASASKKMAKPLMVDPAVSQLLQDNERKINECWERKDKATFLSMVDPDGISADGSGFSRVADAAEMMNDFTVANLTLDAMKVTAIDKDACIVTYSWKGDASYKGQAMPPGPNYASTVWVKRGKEWKAVFHQETMATPAAPAAESH